jgi:hypothetical protein
MFLLTWRVYRKTTAVSPDPDFQSCCLRSYESRSTLALLAPAEQTNHSEATSEEWKRGRERCGSESRSCYREVPTVGRHTVIAAIMELPRVRKEIQE